MFDAVRNNRIVVQGILGLIVLTFAFFGVESYLGNGGREQPLAEVAGQPISRAEFENELRQQQDRMRASLGGSVDLETLNSPAVRAQVLESLINRRLLAQFANDQKLAVPDGQLRDVIANLPAFQDNGQFSKARYEQLLASQGLSQPGFEAQMRQDLAFQQMISAMGGGSLASHTSAMQLLKLQLEERKVQLARLSAEKFAKGVSVSDAEIAKYYDENKPRFEQAARVKAEYVILSRDALRSQIKVDEAEIRNWYEGHQGSYGAEEERGARHILIQVAADAKDKELAAAKAKAESLLARVKADGGKTFAEIAKAESQDPGSAAQGGDLGSFSRGMMVKPFEDAVFSLKDGDVSELVRTDFGFHIIQVTSIKPASVKPFEAVRGQIETELQGQGAARKFAELAELFSNIVYEQPDSLKPAADEFELEIHATDWISKEATVSAPFDNKRLMDAVFSSDVLDNHHNTEAIDLGDSRLIAARVTTHEAAKTRPMTEVRDQIVAELTREAAARAAVAAGEAALASLQNGSTPASIEFGAEQSLKRSDASLGANAMRAIFSAPSGTLPAYVGASLPDGSYAVIRLLAVNRSDVAKDDPRVAALRRQYEQLIGERDLAVFLKALRKAYGVEVHQAEVQRS